MRAVVRTVHLPVNKSSPEDIMPRDVGSVVLMNVGFGITGRYSNFGGRLYITLGVSPLGIFDQGKEGVLSVEREICVKNQRGIHKEETVV